MKYNKILCKVRLKPQKIFECACLDGFKGDFCEFKTEQNHIVYGKYIINTDGRIESNIGHKYNYIAIDWRD